MVEGEPARRTVPRYKRGENSALKESLANLLQTARQRLSEHYRQDMEHSESFTGL
jgi:hypothetical protein